MLISGAESVGCQGAVLSSERENDVCDQADGLMVLALLCSHKSVTISAVNDVGCGS